MGILKKLFIVTVTILLTSFKSYSTDSTKNGIASHYAKHFEGKRTATGEVFKNSQMTAASNHFKLNSQVKVTDVSSGRSIIVRINDRMAPSMAKKGRIIDLSQGAAKLLGVLSNGLTKVLVELL